MLYTLRRAAVKNKNVGIREEREFVSSSSAAAAAAAAAAAVRVQQGTKRQIISSTHLAFHPASPPHIITSLPANAIMQLSFLRGV